MQGSSPLRGALLGLVLEHPGHPGGLASRLEMRLGPAWQVDPKDIGRTAKRLQKLGLLASDENPAAAATDRRTVYFPTHRTQAALTEWMEMGVQIKPIRVELQAKMAVARPQDIPRLLAAFDVYERECFALLKTSGVKLAPPTSLTAVGIHLARRSALAHLRAEIKWITEARRMLTEFAASL
jgi:DNA-binding PadR family transcriptional regulator